MAAARVRTERFLLRWRTVEPTQGTFDWGRTDRIVGGLASHGIRPVPFVWGSPPWVRRGPCASPGRQRVRRVGVAELPQGGGGALRTGRQLLGERLPPAVRGGRHAAADPVLADLERAQSEEVLRSGGTSGQAANKYAQLLRISHDAIKSQDPQARIVLAGMPGYGEPDWPGTSSTASTRCPGSRTTSTSPPCTPMRATWTSSAGRFCSSAG